MSLQIPTTQELYNIFLSNFESRLNQDAPESEKAYMQAESKVYAGVAKGHYNYMAERVLQNLAYTATGDGLDNIGTEYGLTRDPAEATQLEIELPGSNGTVIPAGTDFVGDSNGERYFSDASATIAGGVAVIDITAENIGAAGNLVVGTDTLSIGKQIAGAESQGDVTDILNIGLDEETDESYRPRILTVIRATRGGGNATDYKIWAESVAGVERAFPINGKPFDVMDGDGVLWNPQLGASNRYWDAVTYGNGIFVAVSYEGLFNRVMTSPDGITWTSRTNATNNSWHAVTYGAGLFVAVAYSGTGDRVMTSPDGITWTSRTSAADINWQAITYGNGLFVAVSNSAVANDVMTSPDGITWTIRTGAATLQWQSVTYGNGLFVAVSITGTGNRVMTSPDGITWTSRTSAADISWLGITYGVGLFVAVAASGTGNRVMTSPDGITWTSRTSAADNNWQAITYGAGLFVAVSFTGTGDRVMTSPDGITWSSQTSAVDNPWTYITYGNGIFVAVSDSLTPNNVMTNGNISFPTDRTVYIEAETSIDPDGIAPQSLLDDVRDEINNDPDTSRSRPPLGLTNSTLWVESIERIGIYTEITNLQIDTALEVDAKSDIEDALDLYFATIAPFLDGIDVPSDRNDTITDLSISEVVQDVLKSYGASASSIDFGLSVGAFGQGTRIIIPGELANNEGAVYV